MIRTKDIWEKQKVLENLKSKVTTIEDQIAEDHRYLENIEDSDFEYVITEAHIAGHEKRLEAIEKEIKEKEYELKVMKGEVEAIKPKHWEVQRSEVKLCEFGIEA